MFETIEEIASIAACGMAALSAIGGFVAALFKNRKNKKIAETAIAISDIADLAKDKIVETEQKFKKSSPILKATGVDTGEIKKDAVMRYIQSRCNDSGIAFDEPYWSEQIEKYIDVMNVNKNKDGRKQ